MPKIVWKMIPSGIEKFFSQGQCLRSLAAAGLDPVTRKRFGFGDGSVQPYSGAAVSGGLWETRALDVIRDRYGADALCTQPEKIGNDGKPYIPKFREADLVRELKSLYAASAAGSPPATPVYYYQTELRVTEDFIRTYIPAVPDDVRAEVLHGTGDFRIDLSSPGFADLIRAQWDTGTGKLLLSVIDIKLAQKAKVEHKMQVGMYILLLEEFVRRNGLSGSCRVDSENGYLFHFGQNAETTFSTERVIPFLRSFLNTQIPALIRIFRDPLPAAETDVAWSLPYHIGQKCEWCPCYETCIESCIAHREEIMLLPYITPYAQDYARTLCPSSLSCADFRAFCASETNRKKLSENAYWKRFSANWQENLDMLERACGIANSGKKFAPLGSLAYGLPAKDDVRILLTAQKDNATDQCYLWGISVVSPDPDVGINPMIREMSEKTDGIRFSFEAGQGFYAYVVMAADPDHRIDAANLFIAAWYSVLSCVGRKPALRPQHYVMDHYEWLNLEETLGESETLGAKSILLSLQDLSALKKADLADAITNRINDCPAVVLTSEISRLFVLPALISYNMADIGTAFLRDGDTAAADAIAQVSDGKFVGKKSNVLKNDLLLRFQNGEDDTIPDELIRHIRTRFAVENDLIQAVQSVHPGGRQYAIPFSMAKRAGLRRPDFRSLAYMVQYEGKLIRVKAGTSRSLAFDRAKAEGKCWIIRPCEDTVIYPATFVVENGETMHRDEFYGVVCMNTDAARHRLPLYDDTANAADNSTVIGIPYCAVAISNVRAENGRYLLDLDLTNEEARRDFPHGDFFSDNPDGFLLFETVGEVNLHRNLETLTIADRKDPNVLCPDVVRIRTDFDSSAGAELCDAGKIGTENFTPSQKDALRHLYEYNLTLLLGPPGTGKTDFIARSVIALSAMARKRDERFRVLVSANSHAAIDNVLKKIDEQLCRMGQKGKIDLYKVGTRERLPTHVSPLGERRIADTINRDGKQTVVGSTVWKLSGKADSLTFDLIVVDEASQMRLADAVIPFLAGGKETRFLIVGDDNQLPPIISGKYERTENEPFLFGSLFRYFYDRDKLRTAQGEESYTRQLNENFRSNETIFDYSAQAIYGANYRAFDDTIAAQKLPGIFADPVRVADVLEKLYPGDPDNGLLAAILDPAYPLVLCTLKQAPSADVKQREVACVTKLTRAFQYLFTAERGKNYEAPNFWTASKDGHCGDFGIVSPHHEHIMNLKNALTADPSSLPHAPFGKGETKEQLFIGTVDKLQGQERNAVIVNYGVSDPGTALTEGEFILNRNRLNVALTRAKQKCILFLHESLLHFPMEALAYEDADILDGIRFLNGLPGYTSDKLGENGSMTVCGRK